MPLWESRDSPPRPGSVLVSPPSPRCSEVRTLLHTRREVDAPGAGAWLRRSLPGVQAGFAPWWSQSASLCSNDASSCTRVFSWSPHGSTILGMVYSSRRMKGRGLRSMFMSCFSHFWSLAEAAPSSAEDTKEPPSTFLTPDVHHWAQDQAVPKQQRQWEQKASPAASRTRIRTNGTGGTPRTLPGGMWRKPADKPDPHSFKTTEAPTSSGPFPSRFNLK